MNSLSTVKTGVEIRPPKVGVFGVPGIGKTTIAANAPNPIIIPCEDGIGTLDVPRFPIPTKLGDVLGYLQDLYEGDHDYQTVVVDTLDSLEPLIWQQCCDDHGKDNIEDFGYGKGVTGFAPEKWRQVLHCLELLRNERNMAIIVTAHSDIKRFDAPDAEPYDRYVMRLHKVANGLVADWVDCLFFLNYKTFTEKTDVGFNKQVRRGVTTGERVINTQETPAWTAKNRFGMPSQLTLQKDNPWSVLTPYFNNQER